MCESVMYGICASVLCSIGAVFSFSRNTRPLGMGLTAGGLTYAVIALVYLALGK